MPSILDELRASNGTATATGIGHPAGPPPQAATTPPQGIAPPPHPAQPSAPCSCGFATFWLDPYQNWHCEACQPPRFAFQVHRRLTISRTADGRTEISEISERDEKRYEKFIEIRGADGSMHFVNRECLDPRSENFDHYICKRIFLGAEAAEKEILETHEYLSSVLAREGQIDRLPGPWPEHGVGTEEYFSSLPDENKNLPSGKNKKSKPSGGR